jgi:hypothetical protein
LSSKELNPTNGGLVLRGHGARRNALSAQVNAGLSHVFRGRGDLDGGPVVRDCRRAVIDP